MHDTGFTSLATIPDHAWQRCFLGLIPDADTRARLLRLPHPAAITPVVETDLHMTLAFVGAIDLRRGQALVNALPGLATPLPPIPAQATVLWPTPEAPRVAVQGYALTSALRARHNALMTLLQSLGLPVERRPFQPHITLGRWLGPIPEIAPTLIADTAPARFAAIALYSSRLREGQAHYRILAQHALTSQQRADM